MGAPRVPPLKPLRDDSALSKTIILLWQEVSDKSQHISGLEKDKSQLLRQLFQTKSVENQAANDTFM